MFFFGYSKKCHLFVIIAAHFSSNINCALFWFFTSRTTWKNPANTRPRVSWSAGPWERWRAQRADLLVILHLSASPGRALSYLPLRAVHVSQHHGHRSHLRTSCPTPLLSRWMGTEYSFLSWTTSEFIVSMPIKSKVVKTEPHNYVHINKEPLRAQTCF